MELSPTFLENLVNQIIREGKENRAKAEVSEAFETRGVRASDLPVSSPGGQMSTTTLGSCRSRSKELLLLSQVPLTLRVPTTL